MFELNLLASHLQVFDRALTRTDTLAYEIKFNGGIDEEGGETTLLLPLKFVVVPSHMSSQSFSPDDIDNCIFDAIWPF